MRIEVLSEHPDAMLADAERERRRGAIEQQAKVESLCEERSKARSSGRWLEWLRLTFLISRARREATRQQLASALPTSGEQRQRAGRNAERRVARELGEALDDTWLLFRGYRNARGEIDALLVGPGGVFAIEEKYWSARVWVRADAWAAQPIDKYGKQRGARSPMRDDGGRSPSRQVAEPATALAAWLARNKRETRITPVVLLSNPSARIGSLVQPTVRVERSVGRLVEFIDGSRFSLDASRQADIERLVRRDHVFHEAKKANHA